MHHPAAVITPQSTECVLMQQMHHLVICKKLQFTCFF